MNKHELKELCNKKGIPWVVIRGEVFPIFPTENGEFRSFYATQAIITNLGNLPDYVEPVPEPVIGGIDMRTMTQEERDAKTLEMMKA